MASPSVRRLAAFFLVPLALAILLGLGTWQVKRLNWKEDLLATIAERRVAAPLGVEEVVALVAKGEDVDYRAMRATGRFLHDKERHFLATFEGRAGFYIYTPLELADGSYLFVNRGFVPYEAKDASTRATGQVEGEQTVTGLARARLAAKPGMLVPDNDPAKNVFYWKDLDAMASTTGLPADKVRPFFLDADATPNPGGLPKGGVTEINLSNNHLQYAITWYGLAAALLVIALIALVRRRS